MARRRIGQERLRFTDATGRSTGALEAIGCMMEFGLRSIARCLRSRLRLGSKDPQAEHRAT